MLHAYNPEISQASDYLQSRVREILHPRSPGLARLCDHLRPAFEAGTRQAAHLTASLGDERTPRALVHALRALRGTTTLVTVFDYGRALRTSIHGTGRRDLVNERRVWRQLRELAERCAA